MPIQGFVFACLYPRLFSLAWSFLVLPVAAKRDMASVSGLMVLETAFAVLQLAVTAPLIAPAWRAPAGSATASAAQRASARHDPEPKVGATKGCSLFG